MAKGRGGMPSGMNMSSMVKQAQKMQKKMLETQSKLALEEIVGTGGGGAVKVSVNGQQEIKRLVIDREFLADTLGVETGKLAEDAVELLQDTILAALHDAMKKASTLAETELGPIAGGLNIPGLF